MSEERYKPFTCGSCQPRQLKIPHRVSTSPISKRCCNAYGSVGIHFFFGKLTLFSAILRPCAMWHVNVKLQQNFAPIEEWKSTLWDADKLVICKLRLQHGTSQCMPDFTWKAKFCGPLETVQGRYFKGC